MKKLFLLIISLSLIILNSVTVFAISKTELENDSNRYRIISKSSDGLGYLDLNNTNMTLNNEKSTVIKSKIYQIINASQSIITCEYDFIYEKERSIKNLTKFVSANPQTKINIKYFVDQLKLFDSGLRIHKYNFEVFDFDGKNITPHNLYHYEKTMPADVASLDYSIASGLYNYYVKEGLF